MRKNWPYILIIIVFSLLGMSALFHSGLFTSHDIWHQVARLYHYYQGLQDGQLPPYWIATLANGYGYPLFMFSYHLPWILGTSFLQLGFDIPSVVKSLFFISFMSSGIFMFLFIKSLLKNSLAALLSAVLYMWTPYHFLVILVSASMGIAFIFIFLPLILLGIHLIRENEKIGIVILALGTSGIILSHAMHAFFLLPLILFFYFWEFKYLEKRSKFIKDTLLGLVLGLALSSFYLIPATYYSKLTKINSEQADPKILYESNFVNFNQLVYSKWGVSPIKNNAKDGEISFQIGISQWLSIIATVLLLVLGKFSREFKEISIYMVVAFSLTVFLILDYSKPLWRLLEMFVFLDYPFRLILPATFIGSFLAAIVANYLKKRLQNTFVLFIIFVALYTNRNHINVNQYTDIPIQTYVDSEITTNSFHEYLPLAADPKLLGNVYTEAEGENIIVSNIRHRTNELSLDLTAEKEATASLGQFYFPGQTLYLDDKKIDYDVDSKGRIIAYVHPGINQIIIRYEDTNLMKISKIISALAILLLIWTLFFGVRRKTS